MVYILYPKGTSHIMAETTGPQSFFEYQLFISLLQIEEKIKEEENKVKIKNEC